MTRRTAVDAPALSSRPSRSALLSGVFAASLACALGCASAETKPNAPSPSPAAAAPAVDADTYGCPWTPAQQALAWATTSVYENNTSVVQYQYCENIDDGRGYTSGRAGFCTGTGDAADVLECFDKEVAQQPSLAPRNRMAKYAPALKGLTGANTAPLDKIGPYCKDWEQSASDPATGPIFKRCQDRVTMALYQTPACKAAHSWGIHSPLFVAELYDAWVNHGSADDLLAEAGRQAGIRPSTAPLSEPDESNLLHAFLTARLDVLRKDKTWALDVDRVAPYEAARRAGNYDFRQPIDTGAKSAALWPKLNLVDSQAPHCKLALVEGGKLQVTGDAPCTASVIPSSLPGHPAQ
jgi:chitosanase